MLFFSSSLTLIPSFDPNSLDNVRPISKFLFLSKASEKVGVEQLIAFLNRNGLLKRFQSCFRAKRGTETALLTVMNDLLVAADAGNSCVLVLLELSVEFDTVDHCIVLNHLQHWADSCFILIYWICLSVLSLSHSRDI